MLKPQAARSIAGLPKDDLPYSYLCQHFSVLLCRPPPTLGKCSQTLTDESYCFRFSILFLPIPNQAIGYASQHIWCLSQARKNWDGCARKAFWHKMMQMAEVGASIRLDGWQSIRIVGMSACVIFTLHQKIQKMAKCTLWYQLTQVVPDKVQRAVKWLCVCVFPAVQ